MAELEQQNTASDPLASLHKMSTTAGIVSADYVAISSMAIGAAVLGVATSLAIIWPYLGGIAVVGVLLGLLSLRSIRRSNGTLTGRGIAVTGIVLCLLFAAAGVVTEYVQDAKLKPDKQAIDGVIAELGTTLARRDYEWAYTLFDAEWQARLSLAAFQQRLSGVLTDPAADSIRFESNERFLFYSAGGAQIAETRCRMFLKDSPPEGIPVGFIFRQDTQGRRRIAYSQMQVFADINSLSNATRDNSASGLPAPGQ